jgi:hypothetical protein
MKLSLIIGRGSSPQNTKKGEGYRFYLEICGVFSFVSVLIPAEKEEEAERL